MMNQLTGTISVYCRAPDSCRNRFSVRIVDSFGKYASLTAFRQIGV